MKKETSNTSKILCLVSAVLSLVSAIFLFLFWVSFTLHIDFFAISSIIALLGYFGWLFSSFGKSLLKKCTNYVRVFSVSTFAAISTMLVGITIPLSIGKYYDRKAALQPKWIYDLNIYFLLVSIIVGFVLAYMIFKKYYKKQEKCY